MISSTFPIKKFYLSLNAAIAVPRILIAIALFLLLFSGCKVNSEKFGGFGIKYSKGGRKEVTDGIGRRLVLVPRESNAPNGYKERDVIRIPVKRVVVYSPYTAALIRELGHLNSVVGIVFKKEHWHIAEIRKGIENGRIIYLGNYTSIDYEKLRQLKPDVVFTWDARIVPKLNELSIPCIVTGTRNAKGLIKHINFIRFLSTFYNEDQKAKAFAELQLKEINNISARLKKVKERPRVIWGDIYTGKIRVVTGNSWAGQMVEKAGGNYLFSDLVGGT